MTGRQTVLRLNESLVFGLLAAITLLQNVNAADSQEFAARALPFMQKFCFECHSEKDPKGELTLTVYRDEATVLRGRKLWSKALTLIESGEMPPEKKPKPTSAEIESFTRYIYNIYDQADRTAKPDPGKVVMRRLNRAEYNNTVRDLLNIDFNAAEDFPNDEVGHGFDNISDVQWITQTHMERYMAAAEAVSMRAIAVNPAQPVVRHQSGKHLEPAGGDVPQGKFRPISGEKPDSPIFAGPLHTQYVVPADGEYNFKIKLYAETKDTGPVKIAILANGTNVKAAGDADQKQLFGPALKSLQPYQIIQIAEVKARAENKAEVIAVKLPANLGIQRMGMAIVKPGDGKPIPKVFVEFFALEGPLDSRPAFHRKNLDKPADVPKEKHTRNILTKLATRAYRRPATNEEVDRLVKIVADVEAAGEKWEAGLRTALQAILISPKFLFRPELDHQTGNREAHPIGEYELASRLSYFLWSSMPDDELFALAEKNELSKNLDAQVRRMLKDPKSSALVDNFAIQWLQLRRLNNFMPDAKIFPNFNPKLRAAMLEETRRFIDAIIHEDRSILDMLDGNFTFLNETLAQHYGIQDTKGNRYGQKPGSEKGAPIRGTNFVRVELQDGTRSGLLTQASILTVTSNPTRTSPVKRGKWVLEQLLGTPPPPPPPDVPEFENNKVLTGTLRQKMEQHRANPSCAACHARMDPIGFALENFDAIGAYRWKDGNQNIDASGTLPNGRNFNGAGELKMILKEKRDQFTRCLSEKMLTYALGRGLDVYDKRAINRIVAGVIKDNYRFSTLVAEIAKSEPFTLRRGQEESK